MSLLVKRVPITVTAGGDDTTTVRLGPCVLRMIRVELGTLDTPDIDITEEPNAKSILSVDGVAADTDYLPTNLGSDPSGVDVVGAALPVPILNRLVIVTAGAGNATTGEIIFVYEH
ncbi:MAG: hypothetical protein ABSB75_04480 [Candidatus Limnocylindrales bacterium]